MGGCRKDESKNWAEVYDTKTQTWESLPDPGVQLRCSTLRKMEVRGKKIYIISSKKNEYDVYDTKEGRWEVVGGSPMFEYNWVIENVTYYYCTEGCLWYSDENHNGWDWGRVNGLSVLERHCQGASGEVKMANYGGKLLMIWDTFVHETNIWCALVAFERRNGGEVWGKVEWANSGLTVPNSCVLLRHVIQSV